MNRTIEVGAIQHVGKRDDVVINRGLVEVERLRGEPGNLAWSCPGCGGETIEERLDADREEIAKDALCAVCRKKVDPPELIRAARLRAAGKIRA